MDFDPAPFNFAFSSRNWGTLVAILLGVGLLLGFIGSLTAGGNPIKTFMTGLTGFIKDIFTISPKRVSAIAGLTVKEAWRRKALLVFVVFAILLMFAGWFITDQNDRAELQLNVHITFMLTTISWLILPVVMFLSCWGLPEDIRIRSLHTVVTKPVRRIEVVLGRMLGFMTMSTVILLVMGVTGYVWITRQAPDSLSASNNDARRQFLTCRVPVYGGLFFLDRRGVPSTVGINVGDAWMYRSFVEGNSRSRAVWVFPSVSEERLKPDSEGNVLHLESRFEAFRTIKGSTESINEGLEAQYTLVNNPREDAFSSFGVGASFLEVSNALRDGDFQTAATLLKSASERMESSPADFPAVDCEQVGISCLRQVVPVLGDLDADLEEVADAFDVFGEKAITYAQLQGQEAARSDMAKACLALSEVIQKRGAQMYESMPSLEVPLEPFRVSEYHAGDDDNFRQYPRKLSYAADYEGTARFLANAISTINEEGKLAGDSGVSASLADTLAEQFNVSPINAELVADVLTEQIEEKTVTVAGNKLETADGSSWLEFISKLVREEKLISQDPAGWVLEADLFDDIATRGLLRVEVACLDSQMYLGMARPDLFIRLPDRPFWVGYGKALLNIALMLGLVIVLGVTASCVVKGPVSFFFTLAVFVIGQFFHPMMMKIVYGQEKGTGLVESAIMMFQHRNPGVGIDANTGTQKLVSGVDQGFTSVLSAASNIIPDFSTFSEASSYIGNGFDVPWASSILPSIMTFFGFMIPCVIIGSACLKFRELEAK